MNLLKSICAVMVALVSLNGWAAPSAVKFEEPRIYVPLKGVNMTAGYVNIKNETAKEIEIKLKSVEKFKAFETHETIEEAGVMAMKKVDSFKIKKGETLKLEPGGRHLMLFDPIGKISLGSSLKVVFTVDGKEESVKFKIVSRESQTEEHHH